MTMGSVHITARAYEVKELGCAGDGAATWNALQERFDGNTREARRACRDKLFSKSMKPDGDPVDFIATPIDDLRLRLEDMGEAIPDTCADALLNSFLKGFDFIKQMHHRDRSFHLQQIKQIAINVHIDDLPRKSSTPPISWRGAAMAAASSDDQGHHCKATGHFKRDCPKLAQKSCSNRGKKKGKKSGHAVDVEVDGLFNLLKVEQTILMMHLFINSVCDMVCWWYGMMVRCGEYIYCD